MNLPKYDLVLGNKLMTFEFDSKGTKGVIHKIVQFQPTNVQNVYNLFFGDKNCILNFIRHGCNRNNRIFKET